MAVLLLLWVLSMTRPSSSSSTKLQAYVGGRAVDVDLAVIDSNGHLLRIDAANAFMRMRAAAAAAGVELVVESAFRTWDQQKALYDAYVAGERTDVAAPPGWSNHQGGTAVDLKTARGTNAAYDWLVEHAAEFGFHSTVGSEPWHWEFIA